MVKEECLLALHQRALSVYRRHPTRVLVAVVWLGVLDGQRPRLGDNEAATGDFGQLSPFLPEEARVDERERFAWVHARNVGHASSLY